MASRLHISLLFVVLLHAIPSINHASERHALVIGNSDYKALNLTNPINDATDMAAQLQAMGYRLFASGPLLDLDRVSMERAIDEFAQSLHFGASAVFYYAGHGMATDRDSYLLPINNALEVQSQLRDRTVGLRGIVETLKSYNPDGINVLLLDASRIHPLTSRFRGIQPGLQKLQDIPQGVFIGYAADRGQVSNDDMVSNVVGRNSTYTRQLLQIMAAKPNFSIHAMHEMVASTVFDKTSGAQLPGSEDRVYGNWCFVDCSSINATPRQLAPLREKPLAKIEINTTRNYWKIAGGLVLGLVVVAIATDKNDASPQVAVSLTPPGQ